MKRILVLLGIILLFSFRPYENTPKDGPKDYVNDQVEDLLLSIDDMAEYAKKFELQDVEIKELRDHFLETRKNYKALEFLFEYFFPGFVEEHINGAPLLKSKRHSTGSYVVPPQGFQVLDELIFSENPFECIQNINLVIGELQNQISPLCKALKSTEISQLQMAEAMRIQIIRLFTLGLTGFDTPGSLNAIPDAISVFESLEVSTEFLNSESHAEEILSLCKKSLIYLKQDQDFEKFDRLYFLMNFLNPLFERLTEDAKSYKLWSKSPLNPNAKNLFDPNLLDPYYYTELKREEDSEELRQLGKLLFNDKRLSESGKISCASCHNPKLAFTDGKVKSLSNNGRSTVLRNSPSLLNSVYADRYFYDLRAFSLEQQAEHVIFNSKEYNTAYDEIIFKLKNIKSYDKSFKEVKNAKINREYFSKALASYVLSLQSFNSPFDKFVRKESLEIDPKAIVGFNLFMGKAACGTCHFAPNFSGLVPPQYMKNESEILGVLNKPFGFNRSIDEDRGRIANEIHSENSWIFEKSFKTVTVRNVELTAPYFHNGAFSSLEEVLDFYNHGGGNGIGLEIRNQTLAADSLKLNSQEKEALIHFMNSLTDNSSGENL